eukprot:evm.model.scf_811.5 EVM.evm.TU.scf_811.5   scf_811:29633-36935(-)
MASISIATLAVAILLISLPPIAPAAACGDDLISRECEVWADAQAGEGLRALCEDRPYASSCAVFSACGQRGDGNSSSPVCRPLGLLAAACEEFPDRDECARLASQCGDSSAIAACPPASGPPPTDQAYGAVRAICDDHFMDACGGCADLGADPTGLEPPAVLQGCPSPLETLSELCMVHDMQQCSGWKAWCQSVADANFTNLCPAGQPQVIGQSGAAVGANHTMTANSTMGDNHSPGVNQTTEGEHSMAPSSVTGGGHGTNVSMGHDHGMGANFNMTENDSTSHGANDSMAHEQGMGTNQSMAGSDSTVHGTNDSMGHSHATHGGGGGVQRGDAVLAGMTHPCYGNPSDASCAGFLQADEVTMAGLAGLCSADAVGMPWMIVCSLWNTCKEMGSEAGFCHPFTLLATGCMDMPMMASCEAYNSLCPADSVVEQCSDFPPVPRALTTNQAQMDIIDACLDHGMPSCVQCPRMGAACADPMETTSLMCHRMPFMPICSRFLSFCRATQDYFASYCVPKDNVYMPPMMMYFHTGTFEIILFKEWIPKSDLEFALSFLAIVAAGILSQALKALRLFLEARWTAARRDRDARYAPVHLGPDAASEGEQAPYMTAGQASRNGVRAAVSALVTTLDFALMLVAMTFNVALFFAVVSGIATGTFLFGHVPEWWAGGRSCRGGAEGSQGADKMPGSCALGNDTCHSF